MNANLSLYFIIGYPPNEFFDSSRIGGYFPFTNSILLHSISEYFYELSSDNFHILCVGRNNDYLLLQHFNNKTYCQLGNSKEDIFNISCNQPVKFTLFPDISKLFTNLREQIKIDSSENIIIILQDHGSSNYFNEYPYLLFLFQISNFTKNFFIYNDSCHGGSLVDLLSKNNTIYKYCTKHKIQITEDFITLLSLYAELQSTLFDYFFDFTPIFLPELIFLLSKIHFQHYLFLFKSSIIKAFNVILQACNDINFLIEINCNDENIKTGEYFLTQIDESFFEKLNKYFNFNDWITENKLESFSSITEFLQLLKKFEIKYLANLMMIKAFNDLTSDTYLPFRNSTIFKNYKYYLFFKKIEKITFNLPELDINASDKTIAKHKKIYGQIASFFSEYNKNGYLFFEFKPNVEIVTSTSFEKTSISYSSTSVNSITKVFPNSPPFSFFIRNAFFNIKEHKFDFPGFLKHFFSPQYYNYPESKFSFMFSPSTSLPKKIAAVRFLVHSVRNRLLEYSNLECFSKFKFSCGFSRIPSSILINFISLSILPYSNNFLSDLKLNNKNFLDILKFSDLMFKSHSTETSINDHFEFITFFSVIISSKIRYLLAQQLLFLTKSDSSLSNTISLFSINELEYIKDFISDKL